MAGVLNGFLGGGISPSAMSSAGPISSHPQISNYAPVQVNSTGLNLGEILKELNDGPPENGGHSVPGSISFPQISRLPTSSDVGTPISVGKVTPYSGNKRKILIAGGVTVVALVAWFVLT